MASHVSRRKSKSTTGSQICAEYCDRISRLGRTVNGRHEHTCCRFNRSPETGPIPCTAENGDGDACRTLSAISPNLAPLRPACALTASDAHVTVDGRLLPVPVDDEVMALGLARNRLVDRRIQ